jgi:uracil-DNA glycosylase family 4
MVIGEAPGRFGADQSALPFHGDKAGHNFEELLGFAGLTRHQLFITNAVLCNPKDEHGNNAPPSNVELTNCAVFLRKQIDLVDPKIVVTLGAVALKACALLETHSLSLAKDVRTSHPWYGRHLIPLYHTGQRAMLHRSMANQRSDYQFVAEQTRRVNDRRNSYTSKAKTDVAQLAQRLAEEFGELSYFALHKLAYLVEYEYWREHGLRLTSAYFVRQKDGPYCVDLHLKKLEAMSIDVLHAKHGVVLRKARGDLFLSPESRLGQGEAALLRVVAKYRNRNDGNLKTAAYMSSPMRAILRAERAGRNCYNAPINFAAGGTRDTRRGDSRPSA